MFVQSFKICLSPAFRCHDGQGMGSDAALHTVVKVRHCRTPGVPFTEDTMSVSTSPFEGRGSITHFFSVSILFIVRTFRRARDHVT